MQNQDPDAPLWGWADVHEHQFSNLAYGGVTFWGKVFDERGINAALAWGDYTWDFPVWTPSLGWPDVGLFNPSVPVLPYFTWGYPVHGSKFPSLNPPFLPTQLVYGLMVNIATKDDPLALHLPGGTGPFDGWPNWDDGGHQQMYYKWLERAFQGGLRLMVVHMVNNEVLCQISFQREGFGASDPAADHCKDMATVDRQIDRAYELQEFIDGQCQGVECGWYRIATSPQEAREIISAGKLAVVIGIEVDSLFGCTLDNADCDEITYLRDQVDKYYDRGVRHVFPVHAFDNRFAGAALYSDVFAYANWLSTGTAYKTWDCSSLGYKYKLEQLDPLTPLGQMFGVFAALLSLPAFDQNQVAHCNYKGLTDTGVKLLNVLMEKDMIIDIDHLSLRALEGWDDMPSGVHMIGALEIFEDSNGQRGFTYPVISSHSAIMEDYQVCTFDGNECETDADCPAAITRDEFGNPIAVLQSCNLNKIDAEYNHTISRVKRIRKLGGIVAVRAPGGGRTTREFGTGPGELLGYNRIVDIMDGESGEAPFYGEGYPGIAYNNDMGSFLSQTGPRCVTEGCGVCSSGSSDGLLCDDDTNCPSGTCVEGPRLVYPFKAFDGSGEFFEQQTGDRTFDFNKDGLAHIGLMPDLLADVRTQFPDLDLDPLFNSAETYIRMWERIENCTPDAIAPEIICPSDTTIECNASTDPSNTGTAVASDTCDTPVVSSTDSETDSCQSITRTWVAFDAIGNSSECTQTITVVGTTSTTTSSTTTLSTTTTTTTLPPECVVDAECDDRDDCTVDACNGGVCVANITAVDGVSCALGQLETVSCEGETLPRKLRKTVGKKAKKARKLLAKAGKAAAVGKLRKADKLRRKATKQLNAITKQTAKAVASRKANKRITGACQAMIDGLVEDRQQLIGSVTL